MQLHAHTGAVHAVLTVRCACCALCAPGAAGEAVYRIALDPAPAKRYLLVNPLSIYGTSELYTEMICRRVALPSLCKVAREEGGRGSAQLRYFCVGVGSCYRGGRRTAGAPFAGAGSGAGMAALEEDGTLPGGSLQHLAV